MEATHVYTGKTNLFGLANGTPCIIVGKRAGGKVIKRADGVTFTVNAKDLRKL